MGLNPTEQHVSTNNRMVATWVLILRWTAGCVLSPISVIFFSSAATEIIRFSHRIRCQNEGFCSANVVIKAS